MLSFRHIFHDLWHDRTSRWLVVISLLANLGHWALFASAIPRGDQFVPLHYTIYFGIDLTGQWTRAFVMPALGTAILLLQVLTSRVVPDETWRRAWLSISLVVTCMLLIGGLAVVRVIQTNV